MGGGTGGGAWYLGVDLGTTYTAAAVRRDDHSEIVTLGTRTAVEPTVVFADGDDLVVGEAAERRAVGAPGRTVRQFKRRLGDPTPLLLGGVPYSAQALLAAVLADVVERTSVEQGGPPTRIAITHPANWGPYKRELVRQVAELAGLEPSDVRTLTEPAAAAVHYAAQAGLEPGSVVAVYDLGGGTFDAAVVRIEATGAEVVGEPTGIEHLGGIDVDAAVLGHVRSNHGARFDALEADEHAGLLARTRDECTRAKEALSSDTDAVIGVPLPDGYVEVRLTRRELEDMIRPALAPTADAMRRAIRSAGLTSDDLAGVLLVGGSSRIPLVSELVSGALGRPVLLDAHPKHAVALGAAAYAAGDRVDDGAVPVLAPDEPTDATAIFTAAVAPRPIRRRRRVAAAVVAIAALLVGGVAAAQLGSDDDPGEEVATEGGDTTTSSSSTSSTESTSSTASSTSTTTTTSDSGGTTDPGGDGGGGGDPRPGTTAPPPPPTTTTAAAAPLVEPGSPTSVSIGSPVIESVHASNNTPRQISVQVQWTPPSNRGSGVDEYVLVGRFLLNGVTVHSTVTLELAGGNATSDRVTFTIAPTDGFGLGDGGFIEWRMSARNQAGSSGVVPASARVPNVVGSSTNDAYRVLWSTGLRIGTNASEECGVETVCSQSVGAGLTRANGSSVTIGT
jgi:molecular chaperone DnaK